MSLDATRWAWCQRGLRPIERLILLTLADRAGADDTAWPSYAQIIFDTGADRKTIWNCLVSLRDKGLISVDGKIGATGRIIRWRLLGVEHREEFQKRNDSKKGMIPKTDANSSENGTLNGSENGTRNLPPESTIESISAADDAGSGKSAINFKKNKPKYPQRIRNDWAPDTKIVNSLKAAPYVIPEIFILQQAMEFRVYWSDAGGVSPDWDKKFSDRIVAEWQLHRDHWAPPKSWAEQ